MATAQYLGPSKACLVIMILRVHVLNNMAE